jgi:hypothetical protein
MTTTLHADPVRLQDDTAASGGRWTRRLASLRSFSLDRRLAAGSLPDSSRLVAARAEELVSPDTRHALAREWSALLDQAAQAPFGRSPRAAVNRHAVTALAPEVRTMIAALLAPRPISVRGAAMASQLLSDGTGPVFNPRRAAELSDAVSATIAALATARS